VGVWEVGRRSWGDGLVAVDKLLLHSLLRIFLCGIVIVLVAFAFCLQLSLYVVAHTYRSQREFHNRLCTEKNGTYGIQCFYLSFLFILHCSKHMCAAAFLLSLI